MLLLNKASILLNSLAYVVVFFLREKDFSRVLFFLEKKSPNCCHGYAWLCAHVLFCVFFLVWNMNGELKAPRSGYSPIALNTLLALISFLGPAPLNF